MPLRRPPSSLTGHADPRVAIAAACLLLPIFVHVTSAAPTFVDVTVQSGLDYSHGFQAGAFNNRRAMSGGVAAGDFDGDGWVDLYVARGDIGPNLLFRNLGNGHFEEIGALAGVALPGTRLSGPTFADFDGDGWLDLATGGVEDEPVRMLRNRGDGTFEDVTTESGIIERLDTFSIAFGDYDRDGDLDVFLSHWNQPGTANHLWRNEGGGRFIAADAFAEVIGFRHPDTGLDHTFTPNFADINNDGWPDLIVAADFSTSQILINDRDGTFTNTTTPVISDENGMGSGVGDYDNDGDLDWFVSSIWDSTAEGSSGQESWGVTGNRFYRNLGNGTFEDATDEVGVRFGYWGWGSTFGDFDNDGNLDLFHVNGFPVELFDDDPARLFLANGDGTFDERAAECGIADPGEGRGVVCFDYDRDGDLDLFITNNSQPPRLYRNDGGNTASYLTIHLNGISPNTGAIGARVYVTTGTKTQMRELRAGSNYVSQNPAEIHFGLGSSTVADRVRIVWPDASVDTLENVAVNQDLTLSQTEPQHVPATATLGVNQPNPFKEATLVTFGLPADMQVDLTVFDLSGRVVAKIFDGTLGAGTHSMSWDGRDASGKSVAAGVYIVRLATGSKSRHQKLVRIK